MSRLGWKFGRRRLVLMALATLAAGSGCSKHSGEFLLAYMGDGQGYLEPCG
jgi:hypothetical protein